MGQKGDKLTSDSVGMANQFKDSLEAIGGIIIKKMFGGHGIFHEGKMFGIVDSNGNCYLKADETNRIDFEEKGAEQHGKMPYFSIPTEVFQNKEDLLAWAKKSIAASK